MSTIAPMSRMTRARLKISGLFILYFFAMSMLLFLYDAFIRTAPDIQQIEPYDNFLSWVTYAAGGIIGGILFSMMELFMLEKYLNKSGILAIIATRTFIIMVIYIFITLLFSFVYNMVEHNEGPSAPVVLQGVYEYFTGPVIIINMVFYTYFNLNLLSFHQLSGLVGRGVIGKFLFARFKNPKVTDQVFLFMDLNHSTTIAEKIGADLFFDFIQEFLTEAGEEIFNQKGEVYKYVGDEIIAVWSIEDGARNTKAVQCVLNIQKRFEKKRDYYLEKYGYIPQFKAGIHTGEAMIGELGQWKREIAYMGDSMNTTARIMGACKTLKVNLLVSENYYKLMIDRSAFVCHYAGKAMLRGKENAIGLYKISSHHHDWPVTDGVQTA